MELGNAASHKFGFAVSMLEGLFAIIFSPFPFFSWQYFDLIDILTFVCYFYFSLGMSVKI